MYEQHITIEGSKYTVKPIVEAAGWRFSCIDGDPVLGSGDRCYATNHMKLSGDPTKKYELGGPHTELDMIIENTNYVADLLKNTYGLKVVRQKIELIVYDTKESK